MKKKHLGERFSCSDIDTGVKLAAIYDIYQHRFPDLY
jgi:hypothetical protein